MTLSIGTTDNHGKKRIVTGITIFCNHSLLPDEQLFQRICQIPLVDRTKVNLPLVFTLSGENTVLSDSIVGYEKFGPWFDPGFYITHGQISVSITTDCVIE